LPHPSGPADPSGSADEAEDSSGRSASTEALWAEVQIDPIEIALPGGVGYTLRAYRPAADLEAAEADDDAPRELDDFDAASAAVLASRRARQGDADADADADDLEEFEAEFDEAEEAEAAEKLESDDAASEAEDELEEDELEEDELEEELDEEAEAGAGPDEVPVFLGRQGRLYLFHSPEKLVEFVRSGAEHDLSQIDTWTEVASRISASDIAPSDDDSYELDLVVENLRGGADAWDPALVLKAGELARDIGYALRLEPVLTALAPGSPLDDLDEALRAYDAGGVRAFFARRKLRKLPAQQSALAWRGIIGRISTAVDWRD
jgi:hypothetical protein